MAPISSSVSRLCPPAPLHGPIYGDWSNPSVISFRRRSVGSIRAAAALGKRYKGTVAKEEKLAEMIAKKVAEAMEACEGDEGKESAGCRVAWDEVEEVSRAMALLRRRIASGDDPLEGFCKVNPSSDECQLCDDE